MTSMVLVVSVRTIHLPAPTSDSMIISQQITSAVESFYAAVPYYRVGVGLLDIEPGLQLDMFNDNLGKPALMSVMDRLNEQMGKGAVFVAANGIEEKMADAASVLESILSNKLE